MNEIQAIAWGMIIVAANILLIFLIIFIRKKIQKSIERKRLEVIKQFKIDRKYVNGFKEKHHLVDSLMAKWSKDFPVGQVVVAIVGLVVVLMVGYLIVNQIAEEASTDTEVVDENVTNVFYDGLNTENASWNITIANNILYVSSMKNYVDAK